MSNLTLIDFIKLEFNATLTHIPTNRAIFRFARDDKKHSKSCWLKFHGEIAFVGDFSLQEKTKVWRSETTSNHIKSMSQFERQRYFAELNAEIARTEAEMAIEKQVYITEYWSELKAITSQNPYFARKKIQAQSDFRQEGTNTYAAPMYNWVGRVVGVQLYTDSFKWFAKNSTPKEAFYPIRNGVPLKECKYIFLAEGMATALSLNLMLAMLKTINRMTSWQVLVCFSANNVSTVINKLRSLNFKAKIIGCADNDNAGLGAMVNIPYFVFDGGNGWDASDAWLASPSNAVNELADKLSKLC